MNRDASPSAGLIESSGVPLTPAPVATKPTKVRYGVLGFACTLAMITYLDRVCFGTVAPYIQREFGLSEFEKGLLFTAFALAYSIFEVPTGWLGDVFGPRRTLIRIVLWWSLFTALTGLIYPVVGWPVLGFSAMLAVRFLFGIGEAGAFPNIARAFHNWFPFVERGSAQGAVWMAGRFAGGITPLIVMALLIHTPWMPQGRSPEGVASTVGLAVAPGPTALLTTMNTAVAYEGQDTHWRHTFWIFGAIGLVWCVVFWWWFRDRPEDHPSVNSAELAFIKGTSAVAETDAHADSHSHKNVPWLRLLTNGNLWILCLMYFGCAYGWYFNITYLPGYLASRYNVTRETYGFFTVSLMAGLPLLLGSLACLVGGLLTDAFIRRTGNRTWGRRLFGMVGHTICALCYFASLFAPSAWWFVIAVAMAAFWNDMTMGAAWASCLDIGGKYSGIVSGCMNTIGNLGGAMAGFAGGMALQYLGKDLGWQINFISYGVVYLIAACLWMFFDASRPVVPEAE